MQLTQRLTKHDSRRTLAMLLTGMVCLILAGPALAAESADANGSWGAFLGRMHVVVLHLPIGLIIGAFALEFFGLFRRSKGFDIAAAWLFVLGAGAAIVAVVTGMLYGTEWAAGNSGNEPMNVFQLLLADSIEDGVTETMGWHMWLGITLMVAAIVAAVLKVKAVRRQWPDDSAVPHTGGWPLGVSRLAMVGAMAALPFAGHLGGNMTHGPEFLVDRAPFDVPDAIVYWPEVVEDKPDVIPNGTDGPDGELVNGTSAFWNAKIQPVLNKHCTDCHNAGKTKGKLRLDTLEWAMKGGTVGGTIEPGDAEFSEMYRRVILPPSHDEFMPTNVKKYGMMSQEDIIILGEWLTEFDGKLDTGAAAPRVDTPEVKPQPVKPIIDPAALKAINSAGGNAQSLSQEEHPDQLTVKFAYLKELDPAAVAKLASAADNIAWLTFEGSSFGDEAAKQLPDMPTLTRLNLKDSAITDAGLAELPAMTSLTWLNLFGTDITDAGLESLKQYDILEKLYLTGTKVTAQGVEKLREAMPNTEVFSDHDGQFQFTPVTPDVTPGDPAKDDKATEEDAEDTTEQAAKPINDSCPVSGAPVNAGFVSTFEGKTVGFCCNNCKGKFDADPKKFAAKLK